MTEIYGIDSDKPIAPIDVSCALLRCFIEAHRQDLKKEMANILADYGSAADKLTEQQIEVIVRNAYRQADGNFDAPTKETTIAAMDSLKELAKKYRDPEIIKKHYAEIMRLVEKADWK